ncbi:MAG: aminotransferase class III-fold pyridoxal phosphate-dependent enzyme, partial [Candidatus Tectomicrobia bacterium]|nr:aminotransferase class III-fold pyridoxal phosphate-dependent enzyme [Candidatus Tectomicrobia bacterium]
RVDADTGPYLQSRWRELADHPLVGEARGVGFFGALELVADKKTRTFFDPKGRAGALCRDISFDKGLVMRAVGDTMIISPPLVATKAQIDELLEIARSALDETAERLQI